MTMQTDQGRVKPNRIYLTPFILSNAAASPPSHASGWQLWCAPHSLFEHDDFKVVIDARKDSIPGFSSLPCIYRMDTVAASTQRQYM